MSLSCRRIRRAYRLTATCCAVALCAGSASAQQALPDLNLPVNTTEGGGGGNGAPQIISVPGLEPPPGGNGNRGVVSPVRGDAPAGENGADTAQKKEPDGPAIPDPVDAVSGTAADIEEETAPPVEMAPAAETPPAQKLPFDRPPPGAPGGPAIEEIPASAQENNAGKKEAPPERREPSSAAMQKRYYNGPDLNDRYKYRPAQTPAYTRQYNIENLHLPDIQYEAEYIRMFFDAIGADDIDGARALYNYFKTTEFRDEHMNTPLLYAVMIGRRRMVEALLGMGANPNSFNIYRVTPLMVAAKEGRHDLASLLLHYGALPDLADRHGHTAAMYAASANNPETIMLLGKYGANMNAARFSDSSTALHLATHYDAPEAAYMLLRNGADPDTLNTHRITPLMLAANYNHTVIAKLLLKFDANPHLIDRYGRTAENFAWSRKHFGLAKMLGKYRTMSIERARRGGLEALPQRPAPTAPDGGYYPPGVDYPSGRSSVPPGKPPMHPKPIPMAPQDIQPQFNEGYKYRQEADVYAPPAQPPRPDRDYAPSHKGYVPPHLRTGAKQAPPAPAAPGIVPVPMLKPDVPDYAKPAKPPEEKTAPPKKAPAAVTPPAQETPPEIIVIPEPPAAAPETPPETVTPPPGITPEARKKPDIPYPEDREIDDIMRDLEQPDDIFGELDMPEETEERDKPRPQLNVRDAEETAAPQAPLDTAPPPSAPAPVPAFDDTDDIFGDIDNLSATPPAPEPAAPAPEPVIPAPQDDFAPPAADPFGEQEDPFFGLENTDETETEFNDSELEEMRRALREIEMEMADELEIEEEKPRRSRSSSRRPKEPPKPAAPSDEDLLESFYNDVKENINGQ